MENSSFSTADWFLLTLALQTQVVVFTEWHIKKVCALIDMDRFMQYNVIFKSSYLRWVGDDVKSVVRQIVHCAYTSYDFNMYD